MVSTFVECFLVWRGGLVKGCFVRGQTFVDAGGNILYGDWWMVALAVNVLQCGVSDVN